MFLTIQRDYQEPLLPLRLQWRYYLHKLNFSVLPSVMLEF